MSKRLFTVLPAAMALLAVACGSGQSSLIPKVLSREAALKRALFAYSVEFLRRFPTTNTYLGGAGLDPKLRDVDGRCGTIPSRPSRPKTGGSPASRRR